MAFPFCPMTDEILKKLSRAAQDSNQYIKSSDLNVECASQESKSNLNLNLIPTDTDQSDARTNNNL